MHTGNNTPLAVHIQGLRKSYGSHEVLKGIDLSVNPGEVIAIIGKSGSGKSTLLNLVSGLDRPTSGEYLFKGVHVEALSRDERALLRRRYFGFVFQGFNLLATKRRPPGSAGEAVEV